MVQLIWQGQYTPTGSTQALTIRVVDKGIAVTPRMAVEQLSGNAAMGEPIWNPFAQFDIGLIVLISLALGIIK